MSINNYLRNETVQFLPTLKDGASLGNEVKWEIVWDVVNNEIPDIKLKVGMMLREIVA
ncbi:MAG: hypothetical protein WCP70_10845 [Methanothrix sp.]